LIKRLHTGSKTQQGNRNGQARRLG
jgi:hypothetical protein